MATDNKSVPPAQTAPQTQTGTGQNDKEAAMLGTLSVVAAAAAPFAPYGTIASAVIVAGISIYKISSGSSSAQIGKAIQIQKEDDYKKLKELNNDALDRIMSRPEMPIDLYSGPPMYWIVTEDDIPVVKYDDEYGNAEYSLASSDGSVKWPCGMNGGSSIYKNSMTTDTTNEIDFRYVYQPNAPEKTSKPAICVFFWAVPIFFARLQQRFLEGLFGVGADPITPAPSKYGTVNDKRTGKQRLRTKDEVCSDEMKKIFDLGCLDGAGNWFGKIGQVIPALALNDSDYSERYYGRTMWVHHQALKNIKYSDGTRLATSGIPKSQYATNSAQNITQVQESNKDLAKNPPLLYFKNGNYISTTTDAGQVLDLKTLLSRYHIKDPIFDSARKAKPQQVLGDDSIYYLTRPDSRTIDGESVFKQAIESAAGSLTPVQQVFKTFYKGADRFSDSLSGISVSRLSIANFCNGSLYSPPFMLFIRGRTEADTNNNLVVRPVLSNDSGFSTYGFFDFDPELSPASPGISNVVLDALWIKKLALFPSFKSSDLMKTDYSAWNDNYRNWWGTKFGTQEYSFRYPFFNYGWYCKNGAPSGPTPDVYEIIKTRPPLQSEETINLTSEFWLSEAAWAWDLAKGDPSLKTTGLKFAIVKPINQLMLCQIKKKPQYKFSSDPVKPLTSAYYRTNLEENKPIIQSGMSNYVDPSPFYCGRRADPRLQFIFKTVRDAQMSAKGFSQTSYNGDTGWEDCHSWSWPYSTTILTQIGIVSRDLFNDPLLKEGIGRAGCSPSSIATGPTIWGDANLYNKTYTSFDAESTDPTDKSGWRSFVGRNIWSTLMELQTGSYSRYLSVPNNMEKTLSDSMKSTYAAFGDKSSATKYFLDDITKKCKETNSSPRRWDTINKKYITMTVEQAADYAVEVIDHWFNGAFPRPTKEYNNNFTGQTWTSSSLKEMCKAHILLKNWALDVGKSPQKKKGVKFPSDYFSMNLLGLASANKVAINSYNDALSAEIKNKNPIQAALNLFEGAKDHPTAIISTESKQKASIKPEYVIAAGAAALLAVALTVKLLKK